MTSLHFLTCFLRSQNDLATNYSHTLAECGHSGQMFGVQPRALFTWREEFYSMWWGAEPRRPSYAQDSMQRLARKTDPRTETLWCAL